MRAQISLVAIASIQAANDLFDAQRGEGGKRLVVVKVHACGYPVIDIEPGDVEQRQFVQPVGLLDQFDSAAHLWAAGHGDIGAGVERVEGGADLAGQGHADVDGLGISVDAWVALQEFAQTRCKL